MYCPECGNKCEKVKEYAGGPSCYQCMTCGEHWEYLEGVYSVASYWCSVCEETFWDSLPVGNSQ